MIYIAFNAIHLNLLNPVFIRVNNDIDVCSVVGGQIDGKDEPAVRLEVVDKDVA